MLFRSLKQFLEQNSINASINTFGFGYSLDCELLHNIAKMGKGNYSFIPDGSFVGTIFILILINNLIGLIPGFLPPTDRVNTTLALGVFSFIYYNYIGCKKLGVVNYLKHFAGPLWYMAILIFPIEIISNFVRPVSLALRLRGNMYGDHLVLSVFSEMAPYLIPCVFMVLGILVSFIQAYVFTALSMVYISLASAHHDHDEHH